MQQPPAPPRRGLVLITTGLLVQLEENEILGVLGHELGHLQAETVGTFYLNLCRIHIKVHPFLPIVLINPLVYIIIAFLVIFFVGNSSSRPGQTL